MMVVIAELLDELACRIPALPGAACKHHNPELFDVDRDDDHAVAAARAVCEGCPALGACRRWVASLPRSERPSGVVAGRYLKPPSPPPAHDPWPRPSRDFAVAWLRSYMTQHRPVISTQVIADATAAGISLSALRLASIDLGVRRERVPGKGARLHVVERNSVRSKSPR